MGRFYLRIPPSKDTPEHWQLISENLSGPPAVGQLKLATYQGWARHVEQGTIGDELLKLRHRKGDGWHNVLYMTEAGTPAQNIFTYEYYAADVFRFPRFIENTGWTANREDNQEYRSAFRDTSGIPTGVKFDGKPAQGAVADAISSMAWVGDEFSTFRRYIAESIGWYSLPIGAFLMEAEAQRQIIALNDPTGIEARATLLKVDVVHRLQGYSVIKSQAPWMNQYYFGSTTLGLYTGTGELRFQGTTPAETLTVWAAPNGVYAVPTVRNKTFARETDGEVLYIGGLNALGMRDGTHGLPVTDEFLIVQTYLPSQLFADADMALQYNLWTSTAPTPVPIDYTKSYTTNNFMADQFKVVFYYVYD